MTTTTTAGRRVTPTGVQITSADTGRAEWLTTRRRFLCSSDMSAILGVTDYATPLHVYLSKAGTLPDDQAGEAALWGTLLEDTVAREWTRRNRSVTRRIGLVANVDRTWQACTLDRVVAECPDGDGPCALEVKCRSAFKAGQWRKDVPDDVLAQVIWAMETCGFTHMHVAVLIGGNDYRQFTVKRDRALAADIVAAGQKFWTEHVLAQVEPVPPKNGWGGPLADLYDQLNPDRDGNQHLTDLDDALEAAEALREYELGRIQETRGKKRKEDARARLLGLLGPCDTAIVDDQLVYTYKAHEKEGLDLKALRERHPDAYADCATSTTVRTLRLAKKNKLPNDYQEN